MIFQLAVDKNGVIRGNYFDQVTQTNQPVTGAVDKKTQRVAWRVAGGKELVVETGLYNLTMSDSTALVHYGADRTEGRNSAYGCSAGGAVKPGYEQLRGNLQSLGRTFGLKPDCASEGSASLAL